MRHARCRTRRFLLFFCRSTDDTRTRSTPVACSSGDLPQIDPAADECPHGQAWENKEACVVAVVTFNGQILAEPHNLTTYVSIDGTAAFEHSTLQTRGGVTVVLQNGQARIGPPTRRGACCVQSELVASVGPWTELWRLLLPTGGTLRTPAWLLRQLASVGAPLGDGRGQFIVLGVRVVRGILVVNAGRCAVGES